MNTDSYHLSMMDGDGYARLAAVSPPDQAQLQIGWPKDYAAMRVVRRSGPKGAAEVRADVPVELIGAVYAPGGDGPSNGMYALQKQLRRRIQAGLDWLSIKPLPASEDAMPWFWNWEDRRHAVEWDAQERPFVQGPNTLFIYSGSPRIDREECCLLDSANCRAMFCHSPWYAELIANHRRPTNRSPIVQWTYPIDPWPGEPLPDEYDLLIYSKNGHRPLLLEYLAERFPRHIQIHYGSYRREELYSAARRARACAYLADDDHGPLALQEILLAGCPAVGVRTGAALLRSGVTGELVSRLPPGSHAAKTDADHADLAALILAVEQVQQMDRRAVRAAAAAEFSADACVDKLLAALQKARRAGAS